MGAGEATAGQYADPRSGAGSSMERDAGGKKYQSAGEVAEAEGVTRSFVNRLLRLTLLAPDIVEAILEGRQPKGTMLQELRGSVPSDWEDQRVRLRGPNPNQGAKNGNLVTERRLAEGGQRCAFRETWSAFAETSSARSCSSERSSSRDDGRAA
jgi:hypothetical protein